MELKNDIENRVRISWNNHMWNEKIYLSQLFCQLRTLPKININWKWMFSTKDKCIEKDDFLLKTHFVRLYNVFISQKVITIPSLYPPLKYILSFYPQMRCRNSFIWIFALHFHCIRNYDRISNWQKSCDGSIFSLHMFSLLISKEKIISILF